MATGNALAKALDGQDTSSTEPALWTGVSVAGFAGAILLVLQFIFPKMDEGLKEAILGALIIIIPMVVAWITRSKVWSPNSVQKVVDQSVTNALRESNNPLPKRGGIDPDFFGKDI